MLATTEQMNWLIVVLMSCRPDLVQVLLTIVAVVAVVAAFIHISQAVR